MKKSRFPFLVLLALPMMTMAACAAPGATDGIGTAYAEVRLAPADARCLVLKTVGTTTVSQSFDIKPLGTTVLPLKGLPVGSDTISATAFNVVCASVTASTPATYVSDPVTVNVTTSAPVNVSFTMRPAATTGSGMATVDFPAFHGVITEFPLAASAGPTAITNGPDGALWFTESANKIGRITSTGVVTEFAIPTASTNPSGIVTGPDGNLWFAENAAAKIGRLTTTGIFAEFTLPAGSLPRFPTVGPDGNLWFTDNGKIERVSTIGAITVFPVPLFGIVSITAGTDGNLWFVCHEPNALGRITPAGVFTQFSVSGTPADITLGTDGKLYFSMDDKLMTTTTAGVVTQVAAGLPGIGPITAGPDGNIWFVLSSIDGVGRVTPAGVTTVFPTPRNDIFPQDIATGPDGNLWFPEWGSGGSMIARLVP
jgi:virginiamycin B lyase